MKNELTRQIRRYRPHDLSMVWGISEMTDTQARHLFASDIVERRSFLLVVNTEAREKPGKRANLKSAAWARRIKSQSSA